jgi:hypothetical protein
MTQLERQTGHLANQGGRNMDIARSLAEFLGTGVDSQ